MDRFETDSMQSSNGDALRASSAPTVDASSKGSRLTPSFSKFEDGMLNAVRNLNRNPTLREEVARKIS